jgi:hypothetical protein
MEIDGITESVCCTIAVFIIITLSILGFIKHDQYCHSRENEQEGMVRNRIEWGVITKISQINLFNKTSSLTVHEWQMRTGYVRLNRHG